MRKMTFEIKHGSETNKFKATERYWSVFKKCKKWPLKYSMAVKQTNLRQLKDIDLL